VTFSFQTFLAKINAAIGGLIGGLLLQMVGYAAGATQTPAALRGIFAIMTLAPAVGGALMIIPYLFYPLRDDRHREIVREIKARSTT
jgi:Na+/melibiose symporter-like transporter